METMAVVEKLPCMDTYKRVTRRLTMYILELYKYMTSKEVAEHLELNWKTSNKREHISSVKEQRKPYQRRKTKTKIASYP